MTDERTHQLLFEPFDSTGFVTKLARVVGWDKALEYEFARVIVEFACEVERISRREQDKVDSIFWKAIGVQVDIKLIYDEKELEELEKQFSEIVKQYKMSPLHIQFKPDKPNWTFKGYDRRIDQKLLGSKVLYNQ